jgi:hypothetical protein
MEVRQIRRILVPAIMLFFLAVLVTTFHFSTTTLDYSRYNIQWNGTSAFFDELGQADAVEITDLSQIQGRRGSLLVIIAPAGKFTPTEVTMLRDYLGTGNTILLADDFGEGRDLLQELGSGIELERKTVSSLDREYTDPSAIIGHRCDEHPLFQGVSILYFNHPTIIHGGTPLLNTSPMSWLDADGDGRVSGQEPLEPYTLCAVETWGAGELVVISDSSIFINSMGKLQNGTDNRRFLENVINAYPTVLIDQTHSRTAEESIIIGSLHQIASSPLRMILAAGVVLVVILAFRRRM